METFDQNEPPSLPPNYLSLADLQQRWIKQQQQKTESESLKLIQEEPIPEKKEEVCETQKPKVLPSQGKIKRGKREWRGKDETPESQIAEKERNGCGTQKPNVLPSQGNLAVKGRKKQYGSYRERNLALGDGIGGKGENPESQLMIEFESRKPIQEQIGEKEKKVCETQKPNVLPLQGEVAVKDVKRKGGKQQYGSYRERNIAPGDGIGGGKEENPESQLMNESESQFAEKERKVCETQKPNVLPLQGKIAMKHGKKKGGKQRYGPHRESNLAPGDGIGGKDENPESQIAEKERKVCETQKPIVVLPAQGKIRVKYVKQPCGAQLERNLAPGDGIGIGSKDGNPESQFPKLDSNPKLNFGVKDGIGIGIGIGGKDQDPESQILKLDSNPNFGVKDGIGGKDKNSEWQFRKVDSNPKFSNRKHFGVNQMQRKGVMEYRIVKSNTEPKALKMEAELTVVEAKIDGGEKPAVKQNHKTRKNKKKKPEKEKEKEKEKEGGESAVKTDVGDRTVEIEEKELPVMEMEEKMKELPVPVSRVVIEGGGRSYHGHGRDEYREVWKGRSRDVIEGGRRGYHGHRRDEYREAWKGKMEDGLKWVKRAEIVDKQ